MNEVPVKPKLPVGEPPLAARVAPPGLPRLQKLLGIIGVIAIFAFMLAPLVMIVLVSFSPVLDFRFPPTRWSLSTYEALMTDQRLLGALATSLRVALITSVLSTLLGGAAALGIARRALPMATVWEGLFLGPITVPFVVTGLAFLLLMVKWGAVGAPWTLVAAHGVVTLPYAVRAALASLRMADPRLEEAAWIHGATPWYAFRTVLLPQMRPGLIAGMLFSFFISLDEFTVTIFLSGAQNVTLPIRIYQYIALDINPTVMALGSILVVASLLLITVLDRYLHIHRYLEF